jgi:hypothetical protein
MASAPATKGAQDAALQERRLSPAPNCLILHRNPAFRRQIHDIAKAQCEPEIEPNRLATRCRHDGYDRPTGGGPATSGWALTVSWSGTARHERSPSAETTSPGRPRQSFFDLIPTALPWIAGAGRSISRAGPARKAGSSGLAADTVVAPVVGDISLDVSHGQLRRPDGQMHRLRVVDAAAARDVSNMARPIRVAVPCPLGGNSCTTAPA